MVDLGQKGWEQFHLFYWYKVKKQLNYVRALYDPFQPQKVSDKIA